MRVAIDQRLILEAIRRISDAQLIQLVDEAARKGGLKATPRDDDTFLNDEKGCLFLLNATCDDLDVIAHTIAIRISRFLEKAGYLVRDAESEYLDLMQEEEDAMGAIVGASITYRLAFGPNAGRKALTLQTVPVRTEPRKGSDLVTKQAGFSLHAGIACKSHQRKKLERLCRYITRPAIAERRLSLASNGNVVIALKTPYDDGTTHVVLNPNGIHGAPGSAGAQTASQPHPVSWCVLTGGLPQQ